MSSFKERGLEKARQIANAIENDGGELGIVYILQKALEAERADLLAEVVPCLEYYSSDAAWYLVKDPDTLSEVGRSIECGDTESFGVVDEQGNNYLRVIGGKRARALLAKLSAEGEK